MLAILGLTFSVAHAQVACKRSSDKVCRQSKNGKSCYATKYNQNFKICSGRYGYYPCCETPNRYNCTNPSGRGLGRDMVRDMASRQNQNDETYQYQANTTTTTTMQAIPKELIAPQSQSYPENTNATTTYVYGADNASSYEGYFPSSNVKGRGRIKVCYDDSRAVYNGCPSPQWDGPDKNNARNINVNSPADLPPITGWNH